MMRLLSLFVCPASLTMTPQPNSPTLSNSLSHHLNNNHNILKCVSRKHASIHLISHTPLTPEQMSQIQLPEVLNDRILMEYGTPTTQEEIDACNSSEHGVICVLKDLGSKFGK